MLVIREAQMEALRKARRRSFENVAVARWMLRRARAAEAESPESVRSSVQEGIQRALRYGFQRENHILRFLDLACDTGAGCRDWDTANSWEAEIFQDKDLAPGTKLALMEERVKSSMSAQS